MANLNRDIVIGIDSYGIVSTFNNKNRVINDSNVNSLEDGEGNPYWPLLTVNNGVEARTLMVLFCERIAPNNPKESRMFLPGFKGTVEDLPFAANRFIDAYDQLRPQL